MTRCSGLFVPFCCSVVLILAPACAINDPADLIPIVAFASTEGSSTLDPANWSPDTPTPSFVVVSNSTTTSTDSDDCLESNGTSVLVHGIDMSFCVHGWPICDIGNQKGLCPHPQQDLPNGSYCSFLPESKSMYGCVAETKKTHCRLRGSQT